jgi:hypothetical protein
MKEGRFQIDPDRTTEEENLTNAIFFTYFFQRVIWTD